MTDRLRVDPSALDRGSQGIDDVTDRVRAALDALEAAIAAADGSWGDDEIGNAFASSYLPDRDALLQQAAGLVGEAGALGQTVRDALDLLEGAEEESAQQAGR